MKYCRFFCFLLICLCVTSCNSKKKIFNAQRYEKKLERKELRRAHKAHKKEYRHWYKQQTIDVQKKIKQQKRETKQFYKPYGKACTNTTPGKYRAPRNKYRNNGIK